MEPTLHCARPASGCAANVGDRVLARPYGDGSPIRRGDIIAFHAPSKALTACGASGIFVKRVVAVGGETVQERTGRVYVDGKPLSEAYVSPTSRDDLSTTMMRVPAGSIFVMGDNRAASCDSRRWGPLPRRNVIGKALAIYWPTNRARHL